MKNALTVKITTRMAAILLSVALGVAVLCGCSAKTPETEPSGPDISQGGSAYSKIFEKVLNEDYYNNLIKAAEEDSQFQYTGYFDPHPYAFLKSRGHDIDAIKNDELACRTVSFVREDEPNNLYIMTYVESKTTDPYYTEYMLRYTLTDREMNEYKFLHNDNTRYYVQAAFKNDEISAQKKATVISETKMNKTAHEEMKESISTVNISKNKLNTDWADILLKDFDEATQEFTIYIYPYLSKSNEVTSIGKYMELPLIRSNQKLLIQNSIYYRPTTYGNFAVRDGEEYLDSVATDVRFYYPQNAQIYRYDFNQRS